MFETEDDDDVPSMPQTLMGTARSTQQMHQKSLFALDDDGEGAEAAKVASFAEEDASAEGRANPEEALSRAMPVEVEEESSAKGTCESESSTIYKSNRITRLLS